MSIRFAMFSRFSVEADRPELDFIRVGKNAAGSDGGAGAASAGAGVV